MVGFAESMLASPDGHLKLLHSWPPKMPQAERGDYGAAHEAVWIAFVEQGLGGSGAGS
jgi:hypothetical protein